MHRDDGEDENHDGRPRQQEQTHGIAVVGCVVGRPHHERRKVSTETSGPYLRMWGLCLGGWLMARSALAGPATGDAAFAETQLVLARFYAEQLLPECAALLGAASAGARNLFELDADQLADVSERLVG